MQHATNIPVLMKERVKSQNFLPHNFLGLLMQTSTDHATRPFSAPTNKNRKKWSGYARLRP